MIDMATAWSKINSGSHNKQGLALMRAELRAAFTALGAKIEDVSLPPGEYVTESGAREVTPYEPSLKITMRPDAPVQIVLTGHYDTVFPKDYHFQTPELLEPDILQGPGLADMKGGIIVMLNALLALEQSEHKSRVGYSVLLSPDEEIGSPGSAPILAELGRAAHLGLTYEPALADGSLAGARKGSGNFALILKGKAAHAGRDHH
jgi:glutamate carboxypeptidase